MAALDFYKLKPPCDLIGASDSYRVHKVLKQMQGDVSRAFSKHKKGRINCKTKYYKIYLSRSEGSFIVNVKCRETERILLSQRLKVGSCIVIQSLTSLPNKPHSHTNTEMFSVNLDTLVPYQRSDYSLQVKSPMLEATIIAFQ